jgi:hypothetical protein
MHTNDTLGRNEQVEDEELDIFISLINTIECIPVAIEEQNGISAPTASHLTDDNKVRYIVLTSTHELTAYVCIHVCCRVIQYQYKSM